MKKFFFIICLILIYLIIIKQKISTVFIEKIDLHLKDEEVAIIFLSSNSYKSILLKSNDDTALIVLNIENYKGFNNDLNRFVNKKIDYLLTDENTNVDINVDYSIKDTLKDKITLKNINIIKDNDNVYIENSKYRLCIYNNGNNIENCDFIYFVNMNYQVKINENIRAIFYDKSIKNIFKENTYIKWIDNYELDNSAYNILKIDFNNYDIITIPKQN